MEELTYTRNQARIFQSAAQRKVRGDGGGFYLKDNRPKSVVQRKQNNTGLPDDLKTGIENLSGYSMDDVKVHYNSDKPAQLNAHAYAQGTDIHLASGQEQHLPHEAWHVVQQKQGRVQPTVQRQTDININDDEDLESEADIMGEKAKNGQYEKTNHTNQSYHTDLVQRKENETIQLFTVDGEDITKTGATGVWLLSELKYRLLDLGLSVYGVTRYFRNVIFPEEEGKNYSLDEFLGKYSKLAMEEAKRVKQEKAKRKKGDDRIQSWTRELVLSRPAWTDEHKAMTVAGQDIRHIVRNATIKNAILSEYRYEQARGTTETFLRIAEDLNIPVAQGEHPWNAMKSVYNTAFLNKLNLFAGGGGVNRIIGLVADPMISLGNRVAASNEVPTSDDVTAIYLEVDNLIQNQIASTWEQGQRLKQGSEVFLDEVEDFYELITDFLDDAYAEWLRQVEDDETDGLYNTMGDLLRTIGENFGFDLPTEEGEAKDKVPILLEVEERLGNYEPGDPAELVETLYLFLYNERRSFGVQEEHDDPLDEEEVNEGPVIVHEEQMDGLGQQGMVVQDQPPAWGVMGDDQMGEVYNQQIGLGLNDGLGEHDMAVQDQQPILDDGNHLGAGQIAEENQVELDVDMDFEQNHGWIPPGIGEEELPPLFGGMLEEQPNGFEQDQFNVDMGFGLHDGLGPQGMVVQFPPQGFGVFPPPEFDLGQGRFDYGQLDQDPFDWDMDFELNEDDNDAFN